MKAGLNGYSTINKIDLLNDKVLEKKYLENKYFGEGLTIINDNLIQLTWKNKIGFIYDPNTLDLKKFFNYDKNTEGWGSQMMVNFFIYQMDHRKLE